MSPVKVVQPKGELLTVHFKLKSTQSRMTITITENQLKSTFSRNRGLRLDSGSDWIPPSMWFLVLV